MNRLCIAVLCVAGWSLAASNAQAQPILKRVEELVREQLGAAREALAAEPGYLGFIGDDAPDGNGVVLLEVYPDQPAARGGLMAGDVIDQIDGRPVRNMTDMSAALDGKTAGQQVPVRVRRQAGPENLTVTLGRKPIPGQSSELPEPAAAPTQGAPAAAAAGPRLGVRTIPVTPEVQRQNNLPDSSGAQVVSVAVDSAAARAGIPVGAVITSFDGQSIRSPEELAATVRKLQKGQAQLRYVQSGRASEVAVGFNLPAAATLQETQTRPPQPAVLPPASIEPALPAPDAAQRMQALERRVEELEQRIKALEAKPSQP